jgi:hypothetical protein
MGYVCFLCAKDLCQKSHLIIKLASERAETERSLKGNQSISHLPDSCLVLDLLPAKSIFSPKGYGCLTFLLLPFWL